jgi:hypothetical protein
MSVLENAVSRDTAKYLEAVIVCPLSANKRRPLSARKAATNGGSNRVSRHSSETACGQMFGSSVAA